MTLLKQFLELGLDCSPIGLGPGPSQGGYFCTPKGLTVLGWEALTASTTAASAAMGIWCLPVNPMPAGEPACPPPGRQLPGLSAPASACGSTTTLEQAGDWTREQFDTYLRAPENAVTPDAQAVLERIAADFRLHPHGRPLFLHQGRTGIL